MNQENNGCVNCGHITHKVGTHECPHCGAGYCTECWKELKNDAQGCVECEKALTS
jgi:hypothetical protein